MISTCLFELVDDVIGMTHWKKLSELQVQIQYYTIEVREITLG